MISNDDIGNLGRLGNQMFQYAALRGLAAKHNYSYCLPPKNYVGLKDPNCAKSDVNIFQCFKLKEAPSQITNYPRYVERCFELDQDLWDNCPDKINIWGYFQTEKYFKHIEDEIRKDFTFVDEILEPCEEYFTENFDNTQVISLHIRRGDYLDNPYHIVQGIDYYSKALSNFERDIPVLVFSDGIEWCKEQEFFNQDRFYFSESDSTAVDLCLQSLCSYHIIGNSSYSWWGSWLANSKKTVAPSNWFHKELYKDKNTKDLYLPDWIII